ncbi:RidA family protein [Fontisubflavum oceani]|uniref:RidA family protein n=1 Tax=Fontisubflavum oceani TaxID=2978973 RepID=UPI0025B49A5A|nr:RidA family protein [Fontisubflavum oceani]WJY20781.1 RidA family protein [Fontisubflavum oceani]
MAESANPDGIWPPFGAFSQVVIAGEGQVVHLKGQVALDQDGEIVGAGDMAAQTKQVLENIKTLLASLGGRLSDVVSLTQYTTDLGDFMEMGALRATYFAAPYPVTTTVEVAALYHPDLLLEIQAVAEIPRERFRRPEDVSPLHG